MAVVVDIFFMVSNDESCFIVLICGNGDFFLLSAAVFLFDNDFDCDFGRRLFFIVAAVLGLTGFTLIDSDLCN